MTSFAILLFAFAVLAGIANLVADYRGPRWLVYVAKPLTTTLLLVAAASMHTGDRRYQLAILAGLACSLAGDVFLMLPRDHFIAGLASFLVAHIAYIIAFTRGTSFASRPLLLLPYAIAAGTVLTILWPHLGKLKLPVAVYVAVIVVMAWQAATRADVHPAIATCAAAAGAALFVISDTTLAIDRFGKPFRAAQAIVMSTYVAAQMLIAFSVAG